MNTWANSGKECTSLGWGWCLEAGLLTPACISTLGCVWSVETKVPRDGRHRTSRKRVLVSVGLRSNAAGQEVGGYHLQKTDCKRSPVRNSHVKPDIDFFTFTVSNIPVILPSPGPAVCGQFPLDDADAAGQEPCTELPTASMRDGALLLQALQQLPGRVAVRRQAQAALVVANPALRGRAHRAVGRAAVKAACVQCRLQRQQLAA